MAAFGRHDCLSFEPVVRIQFSIPFMIALSMGQHAFNG